jgi:group I intron endonuclease
MRSIASPIYFNIIYGGIIMIGIYKITNKITGKSYIGQSVNIETRWSQHKSVSRSYETLDGNELHKDILELGVENFSFEVIE